MLPNRLNLPKQTEERLRRLNQNTGIKPNVGSRIAFFKSLERGFTYKNSSIKLDGPLAQDKITWLGDCRESIEMLLKQRYSELPSKELAKAWASHVEDGMSGLAGSRSLLSLISRL